MSFLDDLGRTAGDIVESATSLAKGIGDQIEGSGLQSIANANATQAAVDIAVMRANNAENRKDKLIDLITYGSAALVIIVMFIVLTKPKK